MLTLLLVDDEAMVLDVLRTQIDWADLGIGQVLSALSMRQAAELFHKQRIDILLCDIEMPRGSGLDLLRWMRGQGYHTATIFLTGHADFQYAQQAISLGVTDYVLKPVLFGALADVVRRTVDRVHRDYRTNSYAAYGQRWLNDHIGQEEPERETEKATPIVDAICLYIEQNMDRNLSREEIAAHVNLSPEYVSRIFRKEKQMVLTGYIQKAKVEAAKRALRRSQLTVGEIAGRLGYENFAYFSKVFKKFEGISPVDYRKKHSGSQ